MADKQTYLDLVSIATQTITEYTGGDDTYLMSLEQTSPTHHDEVESILAVVERSIGVLPLAEFDMLLGIYVVTHKYLYRMWCKGEPLPPGPLATIPDSDDPVWSGRRISPGFSARGSGGAEARNEQSVAKLLELVNQINGRLGERLAANQALQRA